MSLRRTHSAGAVLWALCGSLVSLSCDETLPPHEVIPQVLVASTGIVKEQPQVTIRTGHAIGTEGSLIGAITNIHDEVLQDSAHVEFVFEIWLKDRPEIRATVTLDEMSLTNRSIVRRGVLTLGVDSTALVRGQWSHCTDEGVPFWEYGEPTPGALPNGTPYCETIPMRFVVRGTGQLFEYVGRIDLPEIEFTFTYRIFDITCPPPNSD